MISLRLKTIALEITKDDKVIDLGCDHGLLSIYLKSNNLCQEVIATDINAKALDNAYQNIKKSKLKIKTLISNGLEAIATENYNTLVIAGLGTKTIIDVLSNYSKLKPINKIILQSNNDLVSLRKYLAKIGYCLLKEEVVNERDKFYVIMIYQKSPKKNTTFELKYGLVKDKRYYQSLLNLNNRIIKQLPLRKIGLRINLIFQNKVIKRIISK